MLDSVPGTHGLTATERISYSNSHLDGIQVSVRCGVLPALITNHSFTAETLPVKSNCFSVSLLESFNGLEALSRCEKRRVKLVSRI